MQSKKQPVRDWYGKSPETMLEIEKTIAHVDVSTNPCTLTLQTFLFSTYIHLNLTKSNNLMTMGEGGGRWGAESIVDIQTSFEILRIF